MKWPRLPPRVPLVKGQTVNLEALSPKVAEALKACLGKLDRQGLDALESEQVQRLYEALSGEVCTVVTKGMFSEYGPPVEWIKVMPPNPKRK